MLKLAGARRKTEDYDTTVAGQLPRNEDKCSVAIGLGSSTQGGFATNTKPLVLVRKRRTDNARIITQARRHNRCW